MDVARNRWRTHGLGLVSAAIGTAFVFATLILINRAAVGPSDAQAASQASLQIERKEPPKKERQVQRRPPPKRPPVRPQAAPVAALAGSLSGLDFGLPGFEQDDLGDLGKGLLGGSGDVVMTDDSVDQKPRAIQQGPMAYPVAAKARGITGFVELSLLISPTGDVEQVKVLAAEPAGVFEDTAVAGVRGWKFEPALYKGEAVRVWARQRVRFDFG